MNTNYFVLSILGLTFIVYNSIRLKKYGQSCNRQAFIAYIIFGFILVIVSVWGSIFLS